MPDIFDEIEAEDQAASVAVLPALPPLDQKRDVFDEIEAEDTAPTMDIFDEIEAEDILPEQPVFLGLL